MTARSRNGHVEVITGVMFSGKSEELMRRLRRAHVAGKRVQIFKPTVDDRDEGAGQILSHDGSRMEATQIERASEIRELLGPATDVVAIDEAQFFDGEIVSVTQWLADRHVRVIVSGTDLDFRGEPFGSMGDLMARAEHVDKLRAICVKCGEPATRNQRLEDGVPAPLDSPVIQVGGVGTYEARCRTCHDVPRPDPLTP